jgi:hypothetical protein
MLMSGQHTAAVGNITCNIVLIYIYIFVFIVYIPPSLVRSVEVTSYQQGSLGALHSDGILGWTHICRCSREIPHFFVRNDDLQVVHVAVSQTPVWRCCCSDVHPNHVKFGTQKGACRCDDQRPSNLGTDIGPMNTWFSQSVQGKSQLITTYLGLLSIGSASNAFTQIPQIYDVKTCVSRVDQRSFANAWFA